MEDYECEFGFTRAVGSTQCVPTDAATAAAVTAAGLSQFADPEDAAAAAACTSSSFFYTSAYRKVRKTRHTLSSFLCKKVSPSELWPCWIDFLTFSCMLLSRVAESKKDRDDLKRWSVCVDR